MCHISNKLLSIFREVIQHQPYRARAPLLQDLSYWFPIFPCQSAAEALIGDAEDKDEPDEDSDDDEGEEEEEEKTSSAKKLWRFLIT